MQTEEHGAIGKSGNEPARRGGELTISFQGQPLTLDPAVAWETTDCSIVHAIYQGLFRYAPEMGAAGTHLEPCLAMAIPTVENGGISEDGRTITIALRPGVRFQEPIGREVVAADFKHSFERMMNPRLVPAAPATYFYTGIVGVRDFQRGAAREIAGITVADTRTIRVSLERPDFTLLHLLALDFCAFVPHEWVEQCDNDISRRPLGTGPFRLVEWAHGREIVLERNAVYWDATRPFLDRVNFALSYSPTTAVAMIDHGGVDVVGNSLPPAAAVRVRGDAAWQGRLHHDPEIAGQYLFLNSQVAPFDDSRVRRAVAWAIDRERIVDLLANGATPLLQLYPPGLPGHRPGAGFCGHDPARARALLAEAGHSDGFDTKLYTDNIEPDPQVMALVREDLAAIGIRAEVFELTSAAFASLQGTPRALAAGIFGWWMDFPDPVNWVAPLLGRDSIGGMNSSFWSHPEIESLLAEAATLGDGSARLERFARIETIAMAEMPYAPLFTPARSTVCSDAVGGFFLHPVYGIDPTGFWRKENS